MRNQWPEILKMLVYTVTHSQARVAQAHLDSLNLTTGSNLTTSRVSPPLAGITSQQQRRTRKSHNSDWCHGIAHYRLVENYFARTVGPRCLTYLSLSIPLHCACAGLAVIPSGPTSTTGAGILRLCGKRRPRGWYHFK